MTQPIENAQLRALAEGHRAALVDFCRRMVQTPSPSGDEGQLAQLVRQEMECLGYDEVSVDPVGNVIGTMTGGTGASLMFNCHLDQVDPGDESRWPFPPFSGQVHDGSIWGRGASDTKGALAAQVYALGALRQAGLPLPGDIYVTGVVQEETNGLGMVALLEGLRPDGIILGEATANGLARGHRGRGEILVHVTGRAVHASAPEQGINPHPVAARFLGALDAIPLGTHPELGTATLTPTLYLTDQSSSNVIPGQVTVHLDWRMVPGDRPEPLVRDLQRLLDDCLVPGSSGQVSLLEQTRRSYTGYQRTIPSVNMPYLLPLDHPLLGESQAILAAALGRQVPIGEWRFATDGGHTMAAGIPTIGFSPCEEHLAHTSQDRVNIDLMVENVIGTMALALGLGARLAPHPTGETR